MWRLATAATTIGVVASCATPNSVGPVGTYVGIVVDSVSRAQIAPAGTQLANPIGVTVYDDDGGFMRSVMVTWTVVAGGGAVDHDTTQADANGHATVHWTLGPTPGGDTLLVSAPNTVSIPVTATAVKPE